MVSFAQDVVCPIRGRAASCRQITFPDSPLLNAKDMISKLLTFQRKQDKIRQRIGFL